MDRAQVVAFKLGERPQSAVAACDWGLLLSTVVARKKSEPESSLKKGDKMPRWADSPA
jgi:hypothetical protein